MSCYIAIGGIGDKNQGSICRLWDRSGKEIYSQPLYWPKGFAEIKVFDTDFGRVGAHQCGDLYIPEFDRVLALKGAEIIIEVGRKRPDQREPAARPGPRQRRLDSVRPLADLRSVPAQPHH